MAVAFLLGDFLFSLWIMSQHAGDRSGAAILIGTLIGQFGLCCAAILRHERLYEGAILWLVFLVASSGLVPVIFNQTEAAGYLLLFALIIGGVSLAMNLLPYVIFRSINLQKWFQFSIRQIMLLMALVGISIFIVSSTHEFVLAGIGLAFSLLLPSAIGSFLIGILTQKRIFLASMMSIVVIIAAGWMLAWKADEIWLYLLSQTLTVMMGGYVLMLIECSRPPISLETNSATTTNLPQSEIAPDPLDEL